MVAPVLCIPDAVKRLGWNPKMASVSHDSTTGGDYDARSCLTKKMYLQCLLMIEDITRRNPTFASQQPIAYYELLMRGVPFGATASSHNITSWV